MKGKYAEYQWSIKQTEHGYVWTIWGDDGKPMQTSLEADDKEDRYFETQTAAHNDVIEVIQEYYYW